jgi:hypothetical protein
MRASLPSIVVLALASAGLGACGTEPAAGEPAAEDVAPLVQSNVHVLDAEPGVDLELHDADLVGSAARFPELAHAAPGDILVSGRAAGFLRRVRSIRVDGDSVTAQTEPASLEDVFHQVHVRGAINGDTPVGAPVPVATPGLGPRGIRLEIPKLSLQGKRLAIGHGSEIEIVDGDFGFQPQLDFDLTMHGGRMEHIKVLAAGASTARLHVRYHVSKPDNLQSGAFVHFSGGADGTPLLETPPYYAVFWAGYVPIVVSVRARLLAGFELLVGGEVTGEQDVSADGSVSTGLEYENGGWRDLASKSLTLSHAGTNTFTSHSLAGDITLTARLDVSFYELAGPYVGLQAYAGVKHVGTADSSGWILEDGLRGLAGAQVAIFGKSVAGYQSVLFDLHDERPMP